MHFMKIYNSGLSLRTIFACLAVSFIVTSGFCYLYIYLKAVPQKIFSENYHHYNRHLLRSGSMRSALKEAYSAGQMDTVIWDFKNLNSPVPEEYLLTGIAYLEKNEPDSAIETFKILIQKNQDSKTDYFEDDAEFYLAMAFLDNQQAEKALPIFEKIKADPENRHYSEVGEIFLLSVRTSIAKK
jgi:tetratricopeptide (TPR) repeat protein